MNIYMTGHKTHKCSRNEVLYKNKPCSGIVCYVKFRLQREDWMIASLKFLDGLHLEANFKAIEELGHS